MIVDAHIHVGRWTHADFLKRGTTVAEVASVLSKAGIGGGAVMPTDDYDNEGLLRAIHRDGGDLAWWMFPWIKPATDADDGLGWLREHTDELCGIKIHPSLSRVRITDDSFRPAIELARENDLVVLVHCGRWQEMASYKFAIELASANPTVRFLLAHAGGDTPPLATAAAELVFERKADNVWFDFSGVREYWVIERNAKRIGADRYLMGSDYSLAHPLMYLGAVEAMDLSAAEKELILGGNATRLFGEPILRKPPETKPISEGA